MHRLLAHTTLFCLCILAAAGACSASDAPDPSGTFTDHRFLPESNDPYGLELRIVPTPGGYQGILQICDGEPLEPGLVDVALDGSRLSFDFTAPDGTAQRFQGSLSRLGIQGTLTEKGSSKPEPHFLKRGGGSVIWDRALPDGPDVAPELLLQGTFAEVATAPDGGLHGLELFIMGAQTGTQAVLQILDGTPRRPVLAKLDTHGTRFTFSFTDEREGREWTFLGIASRERVVAELRAKGAKESTIHFLKRARGSIWEHKPAARDLLGDYTVLSSSEWEQKLYLLEGDICFLMTANWMPGEYEERDIFYKTCSWRVEDGQVRLRLGQNAETLRPELTRNEDLFPERLDFGLTPVKPADRESSFSGHTFWRLQ